MTDRLLTERDVLIKTGWPSRRTIDRMMKREGFPHPSRRFAYLGDQWSEVAIDEWMTGGNKRSSTTMAERFRASVNQA